MLIYHICKRDDWEQALHCGSYRAASLEVDGFIHASRKEQLPSVARRYFHGQVGLVLLAIDPSRLTARLQDDPVEDDTYPHIYGPINLDAVLEVTDFGPGSIDL